MRAEATAKNVDWNRVLAADAAAPDSGDWTKLKRLVTGAIARVEERLHGAQRPLLLTYPGLLARYDRLDVLERLRDLAGRRDGLPGVWLLVASDDQQALPTIDGRAVPVITPGEWARIPDQWLQHPAGLDAAS